MILERHLEPPVACRLDCKQARGKHEDGDKTGAADIGETGDKELGYLRRACRSALFSQQPNRIHLKATTRIIHLD